MDKIIKNADMKTVEIQKSKNIWWIDLTVIVNGEKHLMRHQSITIHVADDKPFEMSIKKGWKGSPKYTIEPRNNISLQIAVNHMNQRMLNMILALNGIGIFFVLLTGYFYKNSFIHSFISCILLLFYVICFTMYFVKRRQKEFIISELNVE